MRKNLGFIAPAFAPFSMFTNLTVMESKIHLFKDTQASATNLTRRMVGQAPYVINTGLSYTTRGWSDVGDAAVQSRRRPHPGGRRFTASRRDRAGAQRPRFLGSRLG